MAEKRKHGGNDLTEEEKARYDRQIRVWGSEAQSRIQNTRVLVCGLHGMNMEVIKNIVLAGMSITIQDSSVVTAGIVGSSGYFVEYDDIGKNIVDAAMPRIQELNSFANITCDKRPLSQIAQDESFLRQFNIICLSSACQQDVLRISSVCRSSSSASSSFSSSSPSITLFNGVCFGNEAVFISDFGESFSYKDDDRPNSDFVPSVKSISFPSMESVLNMPWASQTKRFLPLSMSYVKAALLAKYADLIQLHEHDGKDSNTATDTSTGTDSSAIIYVYDEVQAFRSFAADQLIGNGLSADYISIIELDSILHKYKTHTTAATICSIMGSYLAQEVVKSASCVGEPAFNTHIYNTADACVQVYPMCINMEAPDMRDKCGVIRKGGMEGVDGVVGVELGTANGYIEL